MAYSIISDLHINSSNLLYEQNRIEVLVEILLQTESVNSILIFNGDTFDRNRPTLDDIKIFYHMIDRLSSIYRIYISAGNHDYSCFHYLPHTNFTYIDGILDLDEHIRIVSWNNIHTYTKGKFSEDAHDKILVTHARCTIEPYIKEEVDIKKLYTNHKAVILGDIHRPLKLSANCMYTASPSSVTYVIPKAKQHGYIKVSSSLEISRHFLDIPNKIKLTYNSVDECLIAIKNLSKTNLYKLSVKDTPENLVRLRDLKDKNIILDPIPQIGRSKVDDSFSDILEHRTSIKDLLYGYMRDNHKFSEAIILEADKRLSQLRIKT